MLLFKNCYLCKTWRIMQNAITNIFASRMGMLPVGLVHNRAADDMRFAMLDGGTHNFCLDVRSNINSEMFINDAWSSNMSSYIHVDGETLKLYTLDRHAPEQLQVRYVIDHIEKFYQYIGLHHNEDKSVVSFLMDQFRIVRNSLREKDAAEQSLKLFLYMISAAGSKSDDNKSVDFSDVLQMVDKNLLEELVLRIKNGLTEIGLKTNIDLVLRHTSSQLFEEANFLANYSRQLELFPTSKISYSSNPNTVGTFYTPSFIARSIVEESLRLIDLDKRIELTIFDPACGSGEFLSETLRQLKMKDYRGSIKVIGWDLSPIASMITNYMLFFEKREWTGVKFEIEVKTVDSLSEKWPSEADLILMNPPYISWGLMSRDQREKVRSIMGDKGTPNTSSVFYYLASQSLKPDGVIGALVPTSILYSTSHKKIREEAFETVKPALIGQLGYYVFRAAFVDVSIIIASNNRKNNFVTTMLWSANKEGASHDALRHLRMLRTNSYYGLSYSGDFSIYEMRTENMEKSNLWVPMSSDEKELKENLEELVVREVLIRISDVFTVSQGIRTGNNSIFILDKDAYLSLPDTERKFFRPVVDSDSLRDGVLSPVHYVFYPYPEQVSGICSEEDLEKKVPTFFKRVLFPNKVKLSRRAGIDAEKWWLLTRPRKWQYEKRLKMVSTEFGHSGNFGIDETGEYVVERGNGWFPQVDMPESTLYVYVAIFNSTFFDKLLSIYSNRLAGNNCYILENKHVKDIPIPDFRRMEEEVVRYLFETGKAIVKGKSCNKEKLDRVIRSMYGQKE